MFKLFKRKEEEMDYYTHCTNNYKELFNKLKNRKSDFDGKINGDLLDKMFNKLLRNVDYDMFKPLLIVKGKTSRYYYDIISYHKFGDYCVDIFYIKSDEEVEMILTVYDNVINNDIVDENLCFISRNI